MISIQLNHTVPRNTIIVIGDSGKVPNISYFKPQEAAHVWSEGTAFAGSGPSGSIQFTTTKMTITHDIQTFTNEATWSVSVWNQLNDLLHRGYILFWSQQQVINDTIAVAVDSLVTETNYLRVGVDASTILDAIHVEVSHLEPTAESIVILDGITKVVNSFRETDDASTILDNVEKVVSSFRGTEDTSIILDNISKVVDTLRISNDSVTILDNTGKEVNSYRIINDSIAAITDQVSRENYMSRSTDDAIAAITDQVIKESDSLRTSNDSVAITGVETAVKTQIGTGDTFGGVAPNMTLTDAAAAFEMNVVGKNVTIVGSTTPAANDGTFLILARTSPTEIVYVNNNGVAEVFPGTWTIVI